MNAFKLILLYQIFRTSSLLWLHKIFKPGNLGSDIGWALNRQVCHVTF